MKLREGIAWTLVIVIGVISSCQRSSHEDDEQETLDKLMECAGALHEYEVVNDDLRNTLADIYYERGDEIFECSQQVCAGNGWTPPMRWYADYEEDSQ